MPSSVPNTKKQLRDYLRTIPGLTEADKVLVRSAPVGIKEFADRQVTLGGVTATQIRMGQGRTRQENATLTGWVEITRAGSEENAVDAVRGEAYGLLGLVEGALHEPAASQAIPAAQSLMLTSSTLEEVPVDLDGPAGRRATIEFTVTWIGFI